MKLRGNGEKDNHAASCCSHLPTTSKAARTQAAGNSCHPIKLNNLQVLRGSTCVQLAEQIHLLQDAGPSSQLLQFGCAPLTLWSTAKWLQTRGWLVDVKEAGKALLRSVILQMITSVSESVRALLAPQLLSAYGRYRCSPFAPKASHLAIFAPRLLQPPLASITWQKL